MSMFMVAKEKPDGSGIEYPPQLPNDRGNKADSCLIGFIVILHIVWTLNVLCVGGFIEGMTYVFCVEGLIEAITYIVTASAVGFSTMGIFHLAKRTCLLVEELNHIPGRYSGIKRVLLNTYSFNYPSLIFLILSMLYIFSFFLTWGNPYEYVWSKGPLPNMIAYLTGMSFSSLTHMDSEPQKCSCQMDDEDMNVSELTLGTKIANIVANQMDVLKTDMLNRISEEVEKILSSSQVHNQENVHTTLNAACNELDKDQKQTEKEECITHTSLQIEKMNSLDYGSGMAYNFFYGYLRLVLPDPERGDKPNGIVKRIENFMNHHHLTEENFPIKKLFILIPQNLFTPTDLKDVSIDYPENTKYWMEAAVSLESQELDRAGVKQRVYKNSVYKIKDYDNPGRKPVYVVAEGATPLKTLYDVITMNPKMSSVFKDHQPEIVSTFYKTLLEIIRDNDYCRDLCEIIYYADTDQHNEKVNVARIILERIQELELRRVNRMAAANDN